MKFKYDIFISYRRSDSFATAQLIYDRLEKAGYRVSFDMETLRSGNFNTQLYERIENCRDVIVIVSSDALKFRDDPEHDWMRLEVAYALKHGKNIIPVFLRNVNIPPKESLPEDVADLVMKNGVTASEEHFDSTISRICRMLHARKKIKPLKIALICGIILIFSTGICLPWYIHQEHHIYNQFVFQISLFNQTSQDHDKLLNTFRQAILTGKTDDFEKARINLQASIDKLRAIKFSHSTIIKDSQGNVTEEFQQIRQKYLEDMIRNVQELDEIVKKGKNIEDDQLQKIIEMQKERGRLLSERVSLNFIALLHKAPRRVVKKFKGAEAAQLKHLPQLSSQWPSYEDIENKVKQVNEEIKKLTFPRDKVIKIPDSIKKWVIQAAQRGNAEAQYCLGNYYQNGLIGEKNIEKAKELYKKASDQGHKKAQKALEDLQKGTEQQ